MSELEQQSLVYKKIEELRLSSANARIHSSEQVQQIARSIEEFGFTNPVLTDDDNGVLAGHGRIEAAKLLGKDKVPTLLLAGLTEAQRRAYLLADNKLAENAGWALDILKIQFAELQAMDFDLTLTGFDISEIDDLLYTENPGLTDEEEIPEDIEAITQLGDVWELGDHRLVCGDSTDSDAALAIFDSNIVLMVTDPPYGVEYDANWRNEAAFAKHLNFAGKSVGVVENDSRADWSEVFTHWQPQVVYCWCAALKWSEVEIGIRDAGYGVVSQIIWVKQQFTISRGDYHWQHEPCLYAVRKGANHNWQGSRSEATVWNIERGCGTKTGHSTEKPVACMERPIRNNTKAGELVCDPFLGSGTTLIACEKTQRPGIFMEISPSYCDIAVKRWENYTGKVGVRRNGGA